MNLALVAAAVLTVLVAGVHSYPGERFILTPLFRRGDLPKLLGSSRFTEDTLRLVWHVTTVAFLGFAALLVALVLPPPVPTPLLGRTIVATYALSGLVALLLSRGRHPSWLAFFVAAALVLWAFR